MPCSGDHRGAAASVRSGVVACAATGLLLTGCGGDRAPATTVGTPAPQARAAPAPVDICGTAGPGWRPLRADVEGAPITAAVLGSGPRVVLLNDSGNDPCSWMTLARRLAYQGRSVAVFAYGSPDATADRRSAAETLAVARTGDGPFALVGASLGGRLVFQVAARAPRGLTAIVSLSGERRVQDYGDILPDVRRVRAPVLYLGSREDTLTDGTRQPRQLRRALRSAEATFTIVPGSAHGTELLDGTSRSPLTRAIVRFLGRHRA